MKRLRIIILIPEDALAKRCNQIKNNKLYNISHIIWHYFSYNFFVIRYHFFYHLFSYTTRFLYKLYYKKNDNENGIILQTSDNKKGIILQKVITNLFGDKKKKYDAN